MKDKDIDAASKRVTIYARVSTSRLCPYGG